ncbi:DUF1493 family protein [Hymenobacter radiodurans]|uniref:DUF1493 family protein n=1 Tax=Hymenobacter radiodurans TaxID=2496028 RepID=UPI001058F23A|nr:DUF1493 family protein [Hymenobacter radiodurans]
METIQVSFTELRRTTQRVITFMQVEYWLEADSGLRTAIEDDLGITGLDAEELLKAFSKQFDTDLTDLNFDQYFASEGMEINSLKGVLLAPIAIAFCALLLVWFFVQCLLSLLALPFDKQEARKVFEFSLIGKWGLYSRRRWPNTHPETTFNIGDLVASAAAGHFVKRERVRFVLV